MRLKLVFQLMVLIAATTLFAQPSLTITSTLDKAAYTTGDTVIVALECAIPAGFHLYSNPLGPGIGKPLQLYTREKTGIIWVAAYKSPPKKYQPPIEGWVYAYEKKAWFFLKGVIAVGAESVINDTISLSALICKTACLPVEESIALRIPIAGSREVSGSFRDNRRLLTELGSAQALDFEKASETVKSTGSSGSLLSGIAIDPVGTQNPGVNQGETVDWQFEPVEKRENLSLWLAIILAFIAGIILNAMPCVLPVLGIKVISIVEGSAGTKREALERALVFAAGMMTIFLVLATLAAFAKYSWGEQFQKPEMLIGIISAIFIFGLSEFGVFTIILPGSGTDKKKNGRSHGWLYKDYFKGVMTTLLATPCSGPFLGATLAWTLTQTPLTIYIVFAALGLGMAFPYILLSLWTGLIKWLPKPGKWMEDLKRGMAFLLFGFALYLMIALPKDLIIATIGLLITFTFSIMFYTRFSPFGSSVSRKTIVGFVSLALVISGGLVSFKQLRAMTAICMEVPRESVNEKLWKEFSAAAFQEALSSKKPVMIDFTANWCMNCQFNKISVYNSKEVADLIAEKEIIALKADMTNKNEEADSLLKSLGGRSIPFFAIFRPEDPMHPVIMRDIVRKGEVVKILEGLKILNPNTR